MDNISEKEIEILNIIGDDCHISQRKISNNLGLSLGLVNLFLKKLARKGLLKIKKTGNKKSLQYILTPKGFNERLNFNLYFLKKNLKYYSSAKKLLLDKLANLADGAPAQNIFIFGIDDWAEIIYLALQNFDFNLLGFIANISEPAEFKMKFNYNVYSIDEFNRLNSVNSIVIANIENKKIIENSIYFNSDLSVVYF